MVRNPEKKKLTLSIDSEVIEKAKELGLNLSEITEQALKISSLSDDDKIVTPDKLYEAYIDVLKKISKILKKWDLQLKIGSYQEWVESENSLGKRSGIYIGFNYFLYSDGVYLWADYSDEEPIQTWKLDDGNLPITNFEEPEKIIVTLINKLYEKANKNKEVFDKLQIMKNILELSGLSK